MNNMKKLFLAIIAVTSLALPVNAQKFALVDMEYILNHIPAYERAGEQLNQVSRKWQAEVEVLQEEAQTMYKKYQAESVFLTDLLSLASCW
jgi:outer membrane protein